MNRNEGLREQQQQSAAINPDYILEKVMKIYRRFIQEIAVVFSKKERQESNKSFLRT